MAYKTVSVANVGRDSSGTYLDVRCGDAPVEVGQSLWFYQGGRHLSVTMDRVDFFGHELHELPAGHTARIWVSPPEVASLLADGMCLHPRMPRADDTERRLDLLWLASGGKLDGLPCPDCLQATVTVWFTNPFPGEYRTWFLCRGCDFRTRAQNSGKPEHFSTDRVDPDLQRQDQH